MAAVSNQHSRAAFTFLNVLHVAVQTNDDHAPRRLFALDWPRLRDDAQRQVRREIE